VTATNKVYSWGANDKGQLAQWDKKSSMKISPQVCSAWETYREENLPYIEDITINDTSHCPIKDGWKTFRRLLISCGQDHAFSWQTTNDQLKHVHGHVNDESETSQKFQSYEALCPRSQNYSRDMSSMMNSLQKVLSKYELLKVRYKHLKRRAGRWRNHAMHSDKTSSSSSLGSSSQDRVKNALASTVVSHTLENSEFFVHQKNSLNEIRKKRRATREKLGMLEKERAKLKSSINLCQRQLDTQNYNLNALSSAIESGKVKIENYKAQIQELKTQSNESAVSGVKNTLKIENQIKRLQEAKEKASREFDVNVELHKFGKVSLNTKKLNKLQRQLEDMERKIDYETDKFHMYTKESEALKDSLTDVMKQAKLNVFAHESSLSKKGAATSSSSSSSSSNKGSSQLDSILQTAVRLKTRLDRASIQVICKQRISLDDPSKIAQAMIERTETEILRELNSVDGDLMGDVKHLLRSVLLQNCHLRRQANGMRQASDKVNMATKQKKDVDDTKVLFDSDSGSDEYISAGPE
jgi:DNA repair exonuclease SbcCD ATPase subunit